MSLMVSQTDLGMVTRTISTLLLVGSVTPGWVSSTGTETLTGTGKLLSSLSRLMSEGQDPQRVNPAELRLDKSWYELDLSMVTASVEKTSATDFQLSTSGLLKETGVKLR